MLRILLPKVFTNPASGIAWIAIPVVFSPRGRWNPREHHAVPLRRTTPGSVRLSDGILVLQDYAPQLEQQWLQIGQVIQLTGGGALLLDEQLE
jgi:hypothetical protein